MAYDWIAENVCETSADPPGYMCDTPEPSERPTREPTPEVSFDTKRLLKCMNSVVYKHSHSHNLLCHE